jgi:hypothetical protein
VLGFSRPFEEGLIQTFKILFQHNLAMYPMKHTMPPAKVNQRNRMWKRGKAPILLVMVLTGLLGSGRNTKIGKDAVTCFNLMCSSTPPCY